MFGSLRNNIGIARNSTGSHLRGMHKIESRETLNRKYLSKTILACRERQAKKSLRVFKAITLCEIQILGNEKLLSFIKVFLPSYEFSVFEVFTMLRFF